MSNPTDLWWNAIGSKFGERTPRIVNEYLGKQGRFFYTGAQYLKIDETEAEMSDMGELEDAGKDPAVRVRFQEEAKVEAEVLNPTLMMLAMQGRDREVVKGVLPGLQRLARRVRLLQPQHPDRHRRHPYGGCGLGPRRA